MANILKSCCFEKMLGCLFREDLNHVFASVRFLKSGSFLVSSNISLTEKQSGYSLSFSKILLRSHSGSSFSSVTFYFVRKWSFSIIYSITVAVGVLFTCRFQCKFFILNWIQNLNVEKFLQILSTYCQKTCIIRKTFIFCPKGFKMAINKIFLAVTNRLLLVVP